MLVEKNIRDKAVSVIIFYLNDNESDKKSFDEQIQVSFETITLEDSRF